MFDNVKRIDLSFNGNDITNFVTNINLYIDALSPFISAAVSFVDTADFLHFSIGDIVEFSLYSPKMTHLPNVSYKLKLAVAAIPSFDMKKPGVKVFQVSFISRIALLDRTIQDSMVFSNKDVEVALDSVLGKLNVDAVFVSKSSAAITLACNNMTPMQSAFSIMKYMIAGDRADFLMFPNFFDQSELIVKSVSDMFSDITPISLQRKLAVTETSDKTDESNFIFTRIASVPFNTSAFSTMNANDRSTRVIDVLNKTSAVISHLSNNGGKYSDYVPLKASTDYVYSRLQSGEATIFNELGKLQPARLEALLNFEKDKIIVQIPAHFAWFGYIAKTVDVLMPSYDSTDNNKHNTATGKYAISAVALHYQPERDAVMNLELIKSEN